MHFRTFMGLAAAALFGSPSVAAAQSADLQATYDFLVHERSAGGALINVQVLNASNVMGNYLLPASYLDSAAYWGAYVCEGARERCKVENTYNSLTYQLLPPTSAAGKLQVERVNAHNGINIYDAATWQIAVVLGDVKNKFPQASPTSAYALATSLSDVLHRSGFASDRNNAPGTKRAITAANTFVYNGTAIASGHGAFAFRTMAPEWIARDPLKDSQYASFITARNLPIANPAYETGRITWTDWKPITGENAWAFFIGPLQAAHIHFVMGQKKEFVPFKERAVQNALEVLPTFAAMQSPLGGLYYAPAGTVGNEGEAAVDPHQLSVENNFSVYAGLLILRATLQAQRAHDQAADKTKIDAALRTITVMIDGGQSDGRETKGLLSFFKNAAWRDGAFVQGGLANAPARNADWIPTATPKAVDVQTWGISALGTKQIDAWFGFGAAFKAWQNLKTWGAYGVGKNLWGVGYSDRDGNGIDETGTYRQGVMSAEWTAGAITAVRNMLRAYAAEPRSSPRYSAARAYVARLTDDEAAMLTAMSALRADVYPSKGFPATPPAYATLIPVKMKPYLYASRRHYIPFGWYANPLPSTASTAWMIMLANGYDPFGVGGVPN